MKENKIQVIILAAGHGKRMGSKEVPKVLVPFHGKPIISHLLSAIKESGYCPKPALVVGQKAEMIKDELGPDYIYINQSEQLGTGHAVACTADTLKGQVDNVMILYGDHPLVTADMIKNLAQTHLDGDAVLTMAVVNTPDFDDWHQSFYDYGRIIRNESGDVQAIVEKKDSTSDQLNIKEVNPGYYCFKANWLWNHIDKLKNENAQHEYYLTDLVQIACREGNKISTVQINPKEALGVNTAQQLDLVSKLH